MPSPMLLLKHTAVFCFRGFDGETHREIVLSCGTFSNVGMMINVDWQALRGWQVAVGGRMGGWTAHAHWWVQALSAGSWFLPSRMWALCCQTSALFKKAWKHFYRKYLGFQYLPQAFKLGADLLLKTLSSSSSMTLSQVSPFCTGCS